MRAKREAERKEKDKVKNRKEEGGGGISKECYLCKKTTMNRQSDGAKFVFQMII